MRRGIGAAARARCHESLVLGSTREGSVAHASAVRNGFPAASRQRQWPPGTAALPPFTARTRLPSITIVVAPRTVPAPVSINCPQCSAVTGCGAGPSYAAEAPSRSRRSTRRHRFIQSHLPSPATHKTTIRQRQHRVHGYVGRSSINMGARSLNRITTSL